MSAKRSSQNSPVIKLLSLVTAVVVALYGFGLLDGFLPNEFKSDQAIEKLQEGVSGEKTPLGETAALQESSNPQVHIDTTRATLEQLPQQERCSHNGDPTAPCQVPDYDREGQYGDAWVDVDQDGCRTREQVLARDMTDVTQESDCYVSSGTLTDPYTGKTLTDRSEVDIDHVIPLSLAHDLGAHAWDQGTRVAFANDTAINLLAVDGETNQKDKGDKTLSEWSPETDYACTYAIKYVWALDQYNLPITPADYQAANNELNSCDVVYGEPTNAEPLDASVQEYASKF